MPCTAMPPRRPWRSTRRALQPWRAAIIAAAIPAGATAANQHVHAAPVREGPRRSPWYCQASRYRGRCPAFSVLTRVDSELMDEAPNAMTHGTGAIRMRLHERSFPRADAEYTRGPRAESGKPEAWASCRTRCNKGIPRQVDGAAFHGICSPCENGIGLVLEEISRVGPRIDFRSGARVVACALGGKRRRVQRS